MPTKLREDHWICADLARVAIETARFLRSRASGATVRGPTDDPNWYSQFLRRNMERMSYATTWALRISLLLCGCSTVNSIRPVVQSETPHASERLLSTSAPPLYPIPPQVPSKLICTPLRREPSPVAGSRVQNAQLLDAKPPGAPLTLANIPLQPSLYGPRVKTQRRAERHLAPQLLRAAAFEEFDRLRQCYRWARRADPTLEGRLHVRLILDHFGRPAEVAVRSEMPDSGLADCVQDVMYGLHVRFFGSHHTRATVLLQLRRTGLGRPPEQLPRPTRRPTQLPADLCVAVFSSDPVVRLSGSTDEGGKDDASVVLDIDDWDETQSKREAEEAKHSSADGMPRPHSFPVIYPGYGLCVLTEKHLHERVQHNMGALRACYAEAVQRRPGLAGEVTIEGHVDAAGTLHARSPPGPDLDDALLRCLADAVAEVWIDWPLDICEAGIQAAPFTVRFDLDPRPLPSLPQPPERDTASAIESRGRRQLELGDGEGAMRSFSALLRQQPEHERACIWHQGMLTAAHQAEPWLHTRVEAAALTLMDFALSHPRASGEQGVDCLTAAATSIATVGRDAHRVAKQWWSKTLAFYGMRLYRQALRLVPELTVHRPLRYLLADLQEITEPCEAAQQYSALARTASDDDAILDINYRAWRAWHNCGRELTEQESRELVKAYSQYRDMDAKKEGCPPGTWVYRTRTAGCYRISVARENWCQPKEQ